MGIWDTPLEPSGYVNIAKMVMKIVDFPIDSMVIFHSCVKLPQGNQTWRAGKWTIEIGDFPSEISLHSVRGFSSLPCD